MSDINPLINLFCLTVFSFFICYSLRGSFSPSRHYLQFYEDIFDITPLIKIIYVHCDFHLVKYKGQWFIPPMPSNYGSERNVRDIRMLTADCEGRRSIAYWPSRPRPHFFAASCNITNGRYSPSRILHPLVLGYHRRVTVRSKSR